jgi:dCMP deaminase
MNKRAERPVIDEYFLKIASVVAERSTCLRRQIGAVAVRDKHILSTGYNGAPAGLTDCLTLGCIRNKLNIPSGHLHEICRAVHAEQNVIIQAALHGISLEGATIYCTNVPCILCKKMLINVKIKRFVTYAPYEKSSFETFVNFSENGFKDIFEEAGITVDILSKPSSQISVLEESIPSTERPPKSTGVPSKRSNNKKRQISHIASNQELPF